MTKRFFLFFQFQVHEDKVNVSNLDGRDFIRDVVRPELLKMMSTAVYEEVGLDVTRFSNDRSKGRKRKQCLFRQNLIINKFNLLFWGK